MADEWNACDVTLMPEKSRCSTHGGDNCLVVVGPLGPLRDRILELETALRNAFDQLDRMNEMNKAEHGITYERQGVTERYMAAVLDLLTPEKK